MLEEVICYALSELSPLCLLYCGALILAQFCLDALLINLRLLRCSDPSYGFRVRRLALPERFPGAMCGSFGYGSQGGRLPNWYGSRAR